MVQVWFEYHNPQSEDPRGGHGTQAHPIKDSPEGFVRARGKENLSFPLELMQEAYNYLGGIGRHKERTCLRSQHRER